MSIQHKCYCIIWVTSNVPLFHKPVLTEKLLKRTENVNIINIFGICSWRVDWFFLTFFCLQKMTKICLHNLLFKSFQHLRHIFSSDLKFHTGKLHHEEINWVLENFAIWIFSLENGNRYRHGSLNHSSARYFIPICVITQNELIARF